MTLCFRLFLLMPVVLAAVGAMVPALRGLVVFQEAIAVMFAGGIPYLGFVACALIWSIRRGDANHAKAFLFSPLVFGLFCFVYGLVGAYVGLSKPPHLFVGFAIASTFAIFSTVMSAVYSLSGLGVWWLFSVFRKSG